MPRTIVGEIFLNVKPLDAGVTPGVQKIIDKASEQAAEIPVDADTAEAEEAVARLGGQIEDDVGGAWLVATAQAAAFTAAVVGIKRTVEGLVGKLAGIFDQLAQAQAGFTAILGSEEAGGKLLDDIREFARVSPFVTQELVNYSQKLLGVGQSAESIVPLLSSLGDVISSVGGDTQNLSRVLFTLTQIRSIGRLVGQDAIQLQSSLIPITKILADFLDITTQEVKKLQEQGAISADTVFDALQNAGSKVEGAMATATRNITGATAVLSDSVEIMLQDSEFLKAVFDDIVVGILDFEEALGAPEIKNNIDSMFDSLNKLYEGLEPLLTAFADTAAGTAISSLKILAGALAVLAAAVEQIPTAALELIGKSLAIMLALKAPLALLQYGTALRGIGAAIGPGKLAGNLKKLNGDIATSGAVAGKSAAEIERYNASVKRIGSIAGAAAVGVGLWVSSIADGNQELETLGSTLQGAGLGAAIGSTFGVQGAVAGAAAGGGIAAISGFVTSAREESERRAAEITEIGALAAEKFLEGFDLTNTGGFSDTGTFDTFLTEVDRLDTLTADYTRLTDEISVANEDLYNALIATDFASSDEREDYLDTVRAQLTELTRELKALGPEAETAAAQLETLVTTGSGADALSGISAKLAALGVEAPEIGEKLKEALGFNGEFDVSFSGYAQFADELPANLRILGDVALATGQKTATSSAEFAALGDALETVGLTIDDVINLPVATLQTLLSDELPSAVQETVSALSTLKTEFEKSKKAMTEFFSSFSLTVNATKTATEGAKQLQEGYIKLLQTGDGSNYATSLISNIQAISAANLAVYEDDERAIISGLSFAKAQLTQLQEDMGLTDELFENFLETIGLIGIFNSTTDVNEGFFGTIGELSEGLNISEDKLKDILNISEDLADSTQFTITADTEAALRELQNLQRYMPYKTEEIAELERVLESIVSLAGAVRASVSLDEESREPRFNDDAPLTGAQLNTIDFTLGRAAEAKKKEIAAAEQAAEEALKAQEKAQEDMLKAQEKALADQLRAQEEFARNMVTAADGISNAVESAAASIESAAQSWTQSLSERVTPERAVPVSRLIRNAGAQASDLEDILKGLDTLEGRGLTRDAQSALGIDNVSDSRQVKRLLGASSGELAELSQLVGIRDANAEAIARRQQAQETKQIIVEAIIQAASVLGVNISSERAIALSAQLDVTGIQTIGGGPNLPTSFIEQLLNAGEIIRT